MDLKIALKYENFSDEVKAYINKAIDIYSKIENVEIKKTFKRLVGSYKDYYLSKVDKRILSLFVASFLVDNNLKKILDNYDDINVDKILDFLNINCNDITKLGKSMYGQEEDYSEIYTLDFKLDLVSLMKNNLLFYTIETITPEIIYYSLKNDYNSLGSRLLDDLSRTLNFSGMFFMEHPSIKAALNFAIDSGAMKDKDFSRVKNNGVNPKIVDIDKFSSVYRKHDFTPIREIMISQPKKDDAIISSFDGDKVWSILDDIQKKFIGQEIAAEDLFYNIVNNQQLALRNDVSDGERSIIFLDGPTGTGKTAITREITDKLDIPFTATSATNYSSTGYVGGNITDTLKELYNKAGEDIEKAQRGIIVFDEFDKLAYSRSGGLEMKKAVQQQLLDFMGGGKYTINVGSGLFSSQQVEFDTSKLTFVCLAALSDLRNEKTEVKSSIGFGGTVGTTKVQDYTITPQDLIGIGLERELIGRLNTFLHTEEYSKDDLLKILKESTISPLIGFEKWVTSKGKTLAIDEGVYDVIVDAAYDLNTGARSLQTIMNNIRTRYLKEVMRGSSKEVSLDKETVLAITEGTFNRRGRR